MISIIDIAKELQDLQEKIENDTITVSAEDLGMDKRAGEFLLGDGFIVPLNAGNAKAYSALAFVNESDIVTIGDFKCYSVASKYVLSRVLFYANEVTVE